jgi:elongation factor Ts
MAGISATLVKELREKTGAGMMDCKKALQESQGDLDKAVEYLRQKGLASAGKKSGRVTAEGLIDSYIHFGGQIGVLVEVNCETDFVARNEAFKELVQDLAKQIAACPNVNYVQVSDIPAAVVEQEKAVAMGSDALQGKPEAVKQKIVEGKINKTLKEMCLLDQSFIKDQSLTVEDLIKQAISKLGENIKVRRFSRFVLGEGIDKVESNLAEEVAAQVAAKKAAPEPEQELSTEPATPSEPEQKLSSVPGASEPEQEVIVLEPEQEPDDSKPGPRATTAQGFDTNSAKKGPKKFPKKSSKKSSKK